MQYSAVSEHYWQGLPLSVQSPVITHTIHPFYLSSFIVISHPISRILRITSFLQVGQGSGFTRFCVVRFTPKKGQDEGSPDLSATETVNVEIESKVHQLQIVWNCAENLETKVPLQGGGEHDGEQGRRGGAADEKDHDRDQDQHQHPLLRALQGLAPRRPRYLSLQDRLPLQKRRGRILKRNKFVENKKCHILLNVISCKNWWRLWLAYYYILEKFSKIKYPTLYMYYLNSRGSIDKIDKNSPRTWDISLKDNKLFRRIHSVL